MTVSLLSASRRPSQRWRNGAGETYEIASYPQGSSLDDFGWRLSLAEVSIAAPFSRFPGVERHLAVLEGAIELEIEGQSGMLARTPSDGALCFPGDVEVFGRPTSAPARDLNLMVRRDTFTGQLLRHEYLSEYEARHDATVIVLLEPAGLADGRVLHRYDAVWLEKGDSIALNSPVQAFVALIKSRELVSAATNALTRKRGPQAW
jgi:environmental stress-induced protein Ves